MKKVVVSVLSVLCVALCCCFAFAACSGKGEDGGKSSFDVSVKEIAGCSVSVADSAKEGETVSIAVTVTDLDKYIDAVTANGTKCAGEGGKYTFTMPAEDVTIVVKLGQYKEVLSDNGPASIIEPMTTMPVNGCNTGDPSVDKKWAVSFSIKESASITKLKASVRSTNEAVVPSAAISIKENKSGNAVIGGDIIIDTARISEGTTWLLLSLSDGNAAQAASESNLSLKLTVVPYGKLELSTMEETLVFDVSSIEKTGTYTIRMTDKDYVPGTSVNGKSAAEHYDYTAEAKDGKITIAFDYILDHYYDLSISEGKTYNAESAEKYSIKQDKIFGDYATPQDGYDSDGLYFETPELTLGLNVTKKQA